MTIIIIMEHERRRGTSVRDELEVGGRRGKESVLQ
jgi:hypothetical protein